jgi:hypothetical protein
MENNEENAVERNQNDLKKIIVPDQYFFNISLMKYCILAFFSFGLYNIYWFYRIWKTIKEKRLLNISAGARGFFGVIFVIPMVLEINKILKDIKKKRTLLPSAILWIIFMLLAKLPEPYFLISLLSFVFLIPVHMALDTINKYYGFERINKIIKLHEVIIVIFGSMIFILALCGLFL